MGTRTNRQFVMLATDLDKARHRIGGMYVSEKLDGYRGIWIPHSRGIPINDLPFANIEKKKKLVKSTGLFTRYGNVIHAPEAFLDGLPIDRCLDGELWMGRQTFQRTMSVCKKEPDQRNDSDWEKVKFYVFDSPNYGTLFQTGRINEPNFRKDIVLEDCLRALGVMAGDPMPFEFMYNTLKKECVNYDNSGTDYFMGRKHIILHKQELLQFRTVNADVRLEQFLDEVTEGGGEGIVLRHPAWAWEPIRSGFMCKYKNEKDDEAKIIGYIAGKEGKEGKHLGRLGSLHCLYKGLEFKVSGFTDEERELTDEGTDWAYRNPGGLTGNPISIRFPLGSIITFTYREVTNDGIPKEGRYKRFRQD